LAQAMLVQVEYFPRNGHGVVRSRGWTRQVVEQQRGRGRRGAHRTIRIPCLGFGGPKPKFTACPRQLRCWSASGSDTDRGSCRLGCRMPHHAARQRGRRQPRGVGGCRVGRGSRRVGGRRLALAAALGPVVGPQARGRRGAAAGACGRRGASRGRRGGCVAAVIGPAATKASSARAAGGRCGASCGERAAARARMHLFDGQEQ